MVDYYFSLFVVVVFYFQLLRLSTELRTVHCTRCAAQCSVHPFKVHVNVVLSEFVLDAHAV